MIILAGGKGTRLKPYTTLIPKPLVPVGGEYSVLEIVILQLVKAGFSRITLAVNHLADLVMAYFGDGRKWGVRIDYSMEDKPLGTVGPLTLINDLPDNFLVMNSDILCTLDFSKFFHGHIDRGDQISVSACSRETSTEFGVVRFDAENHLIDFKEKPVYRLDVSMGIFCLNRAVIAPLPRGQAYGFDQLMMDALKKGNKVRVCPFEGLWLDIGRIEDYQYADDHYPEIKNALGIGK